MDRHLCLEQAEADRPAELTGSARGDVGIALLETSPDVEETPIGGDLDDLEVLGHEAIVPDVLGTYRPDRADLVRPAPDGLFHVGIAQVDRVNVRLAVDLHRREPHRQRHASNEEILGQPIVGDDLEALLGEIADVERTGAPPTAYLAKIEAPGREDPATHVVEGQERRGFGELDEDALVEVDRSEEHTSELQSQFHLVCRLLIEKKKKKKRKKEKKEEKKKKKKEKKKKKKK